MQWISLVIALLKYLPEFLKAIKDFWKIAHAGTRQPDLPVKPKVVAAPATPPRSAATTSPASPVKAPPDPRLEQIIRYNTVEPPKPVHDPGPGHQKHVSLIDGTVTYD